MKRFDPALQPGLSRAGASRPSEPAAARPGGARLSLFQQLRHRLLTADAASLSDFELVTLLLGRGGANGSQSAARRLLAREGLGDLAHLTGGALISSRRLGRAQAATLVSCFELGRRVYRPEGQPPALSQASDVHAVTRDLELARREYFVALHLDARNRVLSRETVSVGSLNASIVHPREVFRGAIRQAAASIVLVHNHPSGDPEPSGDDIGLTRRLAEAGTLLGIEVLDHLIIGHGRYVSLKSRGVI